MKGWDRGQEILGVWMVRKNRTKQPSQRQQQSNHETQTLRTKIKNGLVILSESEAWDALWKYWWMEVDTVSGIGPEPMYF